MGDKWETSVASCGQSIKICKSERQMGDMGSNVVSCGQSVQTTCKTSGRQMGNDSDTRVASKQTRHN